MSSTLLNYTYLSSVNIHLISKDAKIHLSDTHKIFFLPEKIVPPVNTHLLIGLSDFNMPYSFYNFRSGINNTFDIETYDGSTTLTETITISEGNYSDVQLVSQINTQLTAAKTSLGLTVLKVQANYTTNKLYFTISPSMTTVKFKNISCWKELGFADENDYGYTTETVLNLPYMYNLKGDSSLYVRLKGKGIKNLNSKNIDGILCNIPCDKLPLEYIYYYPHDIQYFKSTVNHLNELDIEILDENMNAIDNLNGKAGFRLTLSVHFSYNKDKIFAVVDKKEPEKKDKNDEKNEN